MPVSKSGRMNHARFLKELFFRDMKIDGQFVSPEKVVAAFPETNEGRLERARFLEDIRSGEARARPEPTIKKSQQPFEPPMPLPTFPSGSLQSADNEPSENEVSPGDLSTVLGLINEVNSLYPNPVIAATKNLSTDFQGNPGQKTVIQLIGTNEGIEKLAQRIQAACLDQKSEPETRNHFSRWDMPGCSLLQIPGKVSMTLTTPEDETGLVVKADTFPDLPVIPQNTESRVQAGNALTAVSIPGCSPEDELLLMCGRINQLGQYLLTSEFFVGQLYVPQSIIFYHQGQYEEAMLMHAMMCLDKAEELGRMQASQQPMLWANTSWLENVIKQHPKFDRFIGFMESWLKEHTPGNDYEKKRHAFVTKIKDKAKWFQNQAVSGSGVSSLEDID